MSYVSGSDYSSVSTGGTKTGYRCPSCAAWVPGYSNLQHQCGGVGASRMTIQPTTGGDHSFTCPYCGVGYSSTHFCQKQLMAERRVVHTLDPQIVILLGRLVAAVERLV